MDNQTLVFIVLIILVVIYYISEEKKEKKIVDPNINVKEFKEKTGGDMYDYLTFLEEGDHGN
jgi:Na+-transporting methylmalonyl-CoA/oxaloacetate decarboxylase gamma subunit